MRTRVALYGSGFAIFILILLISGSATAQGLAEFQLGAGDILEISVWKDEELTREVIVRPDGMVSFPLVGEIQAAGATVEQVRKSVEEKIRDYVPDSPVSVMVLEINSPRVYVVGKVNTPGVYPMQGQTRVMQALAMAGGLNPFADKDGIVLVRSRSEQQESIRVDYSEISGGDDLSTNVVLRPGDTLIVN
ncbi:MAG: polysaccharide biosynthesis/export family protein [Desulfovibrionales bacterium]